MLLNSKKINNCPICKSEVKKVTFNIDTLDTDPILAPHFADGYECSTCDIVISRVDDEKWHITNSSKSIIFNKTSDYGGGKAVNEMYSELATQLQTQTN